MKTKIKTHKITQRYRRYLSYLICTLDKTNCLKTNDINIKHDDLIKKFRLNLNTIRLSKALFKELNILKLKNSYYSKDEHISQTFNIDLEKLFTYFIFLEVITFRKKELSEKMYYYNPHNQTKIDVQYIVEEIIKCTENKSFYKLNTPNKDLNRVLNEYINLFYYTLSVLLNYGCTKNKDLYNKIKYIQEYKPESNELFDLYSNSYPIIEFHIINNLPSPSLHKADKKYLILYSHDVYYYIFLKKNIDYNNDYLAYSLFANDYSVLSNFDNYFDFAPIDFNKDNFIEQKYSNEDYESFYYFRSPLMQLAKRLYYEVHYFDSNFKFNISASLREKKDSFSVSLSGRQTSDLSNVDKAERLNIIKNIDSNIEDYTEYDLHSAIYTVAKLLNKKSFIADYDIKIDLLNMKLKDANNELLSKEDYKKMLFYIFFCDNLSISYILYDKYCKKTNDTKRVSKEIFTTIYNFIMNEVGDIKQYRYNIFILESIFELMIIKKMQFNKMFIKNVYDCFIFNNKEIEEHEFKVLVEETAKEFLSEIEKIKSKEEYLQPSLNSDSISNNI